MGSRLTIAAAISFLALAETSVCDQRRAKASHQPVMDGLTFGEYPDPKRRIEVVQTFEKVLLEVRSIEQQRMDAAAFRGLDDAFDIDLDHRGIEMDRKPPRAEPVVSRGFKGGAKFTNDLPQRAAGLFLVRTAPQQPDQPFAAFMLGLDQRKIAENRGCLLSSQFDQLPVESDREPTDQRNRKTRGRCRRHFGLPFSQLVNARSLPHRKFRPKIAGSRIISGRRPQYTSSLRRFA